MQCRRPPAPSAWRSWRFRAGARLRCDQDKSFDVPCGLCSHPCAFDRTRAAEHPVLEDIGERYRSEKHLDLPAQFFPKIVCETAPGTAKTTFRTVGAAARRFNRLVDRNDNIGNPHFGRGLSQAIAAPRSASSHDQTAAAQFPEQLLEIGQGNFLA